MKGQPVVLSEAMACDLPPILHEIRAMRVIVEESGLGLLVDFSDLARGQDGLRSVAQVQERNRTARTAGTVWLAACHGRGALRDTWNC